jgi:hypothetical protein
VRQNLVPERHGRDPGPGQGAEAENYRETLSRSSSIDKASCLSFPGCKLYTMGIGSYASEDFDGPFEPMAMAHQPALVEDVRAPYTSLARLNSIILIRCLV